MEFGWLAELLVVLLFAAGWGVLELYTRRLDKRRADEAERTAPASGSRHAEGQ